MKGCWLVSWWALSFGSLGCDLVRGVDGIGDSLDFAATFVNVAETVLESRSVGMRWFDCVMGT